MPGLIRQVETRMKIGAEVKPPEVTEWSSSYYTPVHVSRIGECGQSHGPLPYYYYVLNYV